LILPRHSFQPLIDVTILSHLFLYPHQLSLERRANEGRRRFLKYVINEGNAGLVEKTAGGGGRGDYGYQSIPRAAKSESRLNAV
jgi:hypothetical protein